MATPTISEYTAHLRQDKASMRDHLLSANITTKESDTFTDLSKKILEKGNAIRRIYVQPDEPVAKHGLWFKRDTVEDFDVVSDPVPFVGDSLSTLDISYNPDSAYTKIKETKNIHANGKVYYLALDGLQDSYPDESFRIYQYDPYTNTYTKIQTYTANEVYNVRGNGGYYALYAFRANCAVCVDDANEYLYIIGGGYDAKADSQNYITRFGLKSHVAERVHTKETTWWSIAASDLSTAQIVGNKIYVFGQNTTNAVASGNSCNTRIIDLTTGSESTLNHGPIAYQGRTIKVNSHLIAGFGGGASNFNSGQGMNQVRLFDTLTNTTTQIATLANKNNSRALAVVGNLIYFVEYRSSGSASNAVGYIDLSDYSITYIDDVFTPKMQNIASGPAIYLSSARAIVLGNYISQTYLYNLNTKPYDKDTVVLFQSTGIAAQYVVDLFTTNNFKTDVPFNISDAWFYKAGEGLETTGEVYYGNGVEWLPLAHGNTNGGVNALQLQHKTVEITEQDIHVVPDPGFEGLSYVDLHFAGTSANIFIQEEEPEIKEGIWLQSTSLDYQDVATVNNIVQSGTWYSNGEYGKAPVALPTMNTALVGDYVYLLGSYNGNRFYKYNIKDMTFTQVTSASTPGLRSSTVACGTDIYFLGGYSSTGGYQSSAYKYDTLTDTYTKLSITAPAFDHRGCICIGTDIYLFGGYNGSNQSTANKYDILTDTITEITPLPTAGYYIATAAVGTDIYINIGRVGGYKSYKFYKYDTLTDTYERLSDAPCVGSLFFTVGTKIYAFEHDSYNGVYVYDTTTGKWENTGWNQPAAQTTRPNIVLVDNKFYVIGGSTTSSSTGTTAVNVLSLETSTFRNNTLALVNNDNLSSFVATELFTVLNSTTRLLYKLNDVFYYSTETGLDDTIPTYYGDGTKWIKFKN